MEASVRVPGGVGCLNRVEGVRLPCKAFSEFRLPGKVLGGSMPGYKTAALTLRSGRGAVVYDPEGGLLRGGDRRCPGILLMVNKIGVGRMEACVRRARVPGVLISCSSVCGLTRYVGSAAS